MERILPIKGGFNFRELGNYPTNSGKKTASNRIIRSAALDELTSEDQDFLKNYGMKQIIDFRSSKELKLAPDKEIVGATNFFNPVFAETDDEAVELVDFYKELVSGSTGEERMKDSYRDFITSDHARKAYQKFFNHLLQNETDVTLFHCTSGKDRTGFGAFLILSALDVPKDVIWQDYLLTNSQVGDKIKETMDELDAHDATKELKNNIYDLLVVKQAYLQSAIDTLNKEFGDVTNYLTKGVGLSTGDLKDFQKLYLVD